MIKGTMAHPSSFSSQEILGFLDQAVKKEFDLNRRILSFEEYLHLLSEHPEKQLRGSARYTSEMMEHYGSETIEQPEGTIDRFKLFDMPTDGLSNRVIGHEGVQTNLYRAMKTFSRLGINNRLLLLHGPNGSAKTSMILSIMGGLERYSREPNGAIYTFNWVFPVERYTKGGIGITTGQVRKEPLQSYAKLPDEEMAARIPCDMKDHPLLLVPVDQRKQFLAKLVGQEKADELWTKMPIYLTQGDLCHRCKQFSEALLVANNGDLRKVLMHIQVERFYFSRRYRNGLVTVEPQMHVDAEYRQLTMNKSLGSLPPSLHNLNLFSLGGDLVEGNRGIVHYSDLLKRPIDSFKYLLIACETGSVNVGSTIAYLDTVMIGSANELQLDAFKEFPDFTSFRARIDLVRVPYLLSVSQEEEIYRQELPKIAGEKHVAPHTSWAVALWAVLSRLKKPNSINYPPNVSTLISRLTPIEKARLYDTGEMPGTLTADEKKLLRSSLRKLREEYNAVPYYEGRMGASAREMKAILFNAAQNPDHSCLSPLALFREMDEFVKRVSEYEFLKQEVKDGYHDPNEFVALVRTEYLNRIDREVRDSIGLYDSNQWEDFLRRYVQNVSLVLKKEKVKNSMTGRLEDPDLSLIQELEKIVEAPENDAEKEAFRQNIISQVGAWSLDHPSRPVVYAKVFPEYWQKLEKFYFETQKASLTKMHNALLVYDTDAANNQSYEEGMTLARQTLGNMKSKLGYCDHCAKEVISLLMRHRY